MRPKAALALLADRLKPVARPDAKRVHRWIADLDSDDFATRQAAQQALARLVDRIEPLLQEALKRNAPIETRRRLEAIVKGKPRIPPAEDLRGMRAVQALELIGSGVCESLLRSLGAGAPGARLTVDAQQSLDRMARRRAVAP